MKTLTKTKLDYEKTLQNKPVAELQDMFVDLFIEKANQKQKSDYRYIFDTLNPAWGAKLLNFFNPKEKFSDRSKLISSIADLQVFGNTESNITDISFNAHDLLGKTQNWARPKKPENDKEETAMPTWKKVLYGLLFFFAVSTIYKLKKIFT